ncbi:TetR/AcrR family transcriptional regulator [Microbacterium sp. A204]|uniref:TetR/AcrR family transcriptional regulator n=1 Tax=Microbacterium sp. A204 TaxID=3457321 RepID=UPI003FD36732
MPRPRSEKARQSILATMRAAVTSDGYESVTIEGLAAEAGVSKQTIYRWWSSKAAILGEALLEGSLPTPALPVSEDLAEDLRAWFSAMSSDASHGASVEVARALIAVTATDAVLGLRLNERLAGPIVEQVISRVRVAQDAGDVRSDVDVAVVADQFIAMSSYAALLGRPLDEPRVDAVVDVLMRGISAR